MVRRRAACESSINSLSTAYSHGKTRAAFSGSTTPLPICNVGGAMLGNAWSCSCCRWPPQRSPCFESKPSGLLVTGQVHRGMSQNYAPGTAKLHVSNFMRSCGRPASLASCQEAVHKTLLNLSVTSRKSRGLPRCSTALQKVVGHQLPGGHTPRIRRGCLPKCGGLEHHRPRRFGRPASDSRQTRGSQPRCHTLEPQITEGVLTGPLPIAVVWRRPHRD